MGNYLNVEYEPEEYQTTNTQVFWNPLLILEHMSQFSLSPSDAICPEYS
mgnify:CR=1 FL=1